MRRLLLATLFFAVLVTVWHFLVKAGIYSPVLLPSPQSVGEYLAGAVRDGTLWQATAVTVRRLLVGYFIGILLGLPLGLFTSPSQFMEGTHGGLPPRLPTLASVRLVSAALLWF